MKNPWLDVALSDYEGHMSSPEVAQAGLLADIFAEQLDLHKPRSLAVLGCAGGNGFERIDPGTTRRVVGVDLNSEYLNEVRTRFGTTFEQLELVEGDIQAGAIAFEAVDLICAALILEYVDVAAAFRALCRLLTARGTLITVIQLPSADLPAVTPSSYSSLETLEGMMRFVSPSALRAIAEHNGLRQLSSSIRQSPSGKQFDVQVFRAG